MEWLRGGLVVKNKDKMELRESSNLINFTGRLEPWRLSASRLSKMEHGRLELGKAGHNVTYGKVAVCHVCPDFAWKFFVGEVRRFLGLSQRR